MDTQIFVKLGKDMATFSKGVFFFCELGSCFALMMM
jgi:hypothetical protein